MRQPRKKWPYCDNRHYSAHCRYTYVVGGFHLRRALSPALLTDATLVRYIFFYFLQTYTFQLLDKPWSQVSSLLPPRFLPLIFIAHRIQQSHRSSLLHLVLLTHALALSASHFVHKEKSPRIYTSVHLGGFGIRTHETDLYQARG